jgi:hypothetical protein
MQNLLVTKIYADFSFNALRFNIIVNNENPTYFGYSGVAGIGDGSFTAVWDANGGGIFGQLFDSNGDKITPGS